MLCRCTGISPHFSVVSALGQKRTFRSKNGMSAIAPIATLIAFHRKNFMVSFALFITTCLRRVCGFWVPCRVKPGNVAPPLDQSLCKMMFFTIG
jgi:hypothetical protein